MINRKELKAKVPHGYAKIIAKRAKVSPTYVSQFLNGKIDSERIEMATLEVLADLSEKKKALMAQIL